MLLEEVSDMLQQYFDHMKDSLETLEEKDLMDYDNDTKIQVFANIGIILGRILEGRNEK
jgi:hypothetical protein